MYRNFQEIVAQAKELGPVRTAILCPEEPEVIKASADGLRQGLIKPVMVGRAARIISMARQINLPLDRMEIVDQGDLQMAANLCVNMVVKGKVAFIMKGNILTAYILRALIETSARLTPNQAVSALSFHSVSGLEKIFVITDVGMNIRPNLERKRKILINAIKIVYLLGCKKPRVMVPSAPRLDGSTSSFASDATELRRMADEGKLGDCTILPAHTLYELFPDRIIQTELFPDIFLVSNIETGNMLGKSIDHLLMGTRQGALMGGGVMVIAPSRSDGYKVRLTGLALGLALTARGRSTKTSEGLRDQKA